MLPKLYQKVNQYSKEKGERNDCSIIAVALVTNLPYNYVYPLFQKNGRGFREGTWLHITKRVLRDLNVWYDKCEFDAKTVRTLGRQLPDKGRYLITTTHHMLAAIDGEVIDWTDERLHRIQDIWRITF